MDPLLYASITRQTLSETIDGTTYEWPQAIAGGEIFYGLRFTRRRSSADVLATLDVVDAFGALGNLDARPRGGTTRLILGANPQDNGVNTTDEINLSEPTAAGIQAAFNALSIVGEGLTYPECEVTEEFGSFLVVFPGHPDPVEIAAIENESIPTSLVRVVSWEKGGEHVHSIRFIQAPAAFASEAETRVPKAPFFERFQAGSEIDGSLQNEIQILTIPAEFSGQFQILRNGLRTGVMPRLSSTQLIKTELDSNVADEEGSFAVSNRGQGEAWIEFQGSMEATPQELMEVTVARAPAGDLFLKLDLDHPEFLALLRESDEVEVPLHTRVLYRDDVNPDVIHTADWIVPVIAKRGHHWAGLEAKAQQEFLKRRRDSYTPSVDGAAVTGSQFYEHVFPVSADLGADTFTHTHGLGSETGHFSIRMNAAPGKVLKDADYDVEIVNQDQFLIRLKPGVTFADPVVNADDATLINLADNSTIAALGAFTISFNTSRTKTQILNELLLAFGNVDGLVETFEEVFQRLGDLEKRFPNGQVRISSVEGGRVVTSWKLPELRIAYPLSSRSLATLGDWPEDLSDLVFRTGARNRPLIRGREGSLVPAVVPAAGVEDLSGAEGVSFPTVESFPNRVFKNDSGASLRIPGRGGRRTDEVPEDGFLACDGVTWYQVEKQENAEAEETYYPSQFNFELFRVPVAEAQLELRRVFEFPFAFQAALAGGNVDAVMVLEVQFGTRTQEPAEGEDFEAITWADPVLVETIELSAQPAAHTFAVMVQRLADSDEETGEKLVAETDSYGVADSSVTPPAEAGFWIRGRFRNFDTRNAVPKPAGVLIVSGLTLPESFEAPREPGDYGTAVLRAR